MASRNISFRVPEDLLDKIRARDPEGNEYPGATAKRDVDRWYAMLEHYSREIAQFSPDEAVVLIYYVGTYGGRPSTAHVLAVGDSLANSNVSFLDEFYGAAQESLGRKLQHLAPMARFAAWDAAERYQALALGAERSGEPLTLGMALHRTGLHTYDLEPHVLRRVEATRAVESDYLPGAYLRAAKEEPTDE